MKEQPLVGLRIVVCRPLDQSVGLVELLEEAGAEPVSAPVIAITDPPDGGAALRGAMAGLTRGDWLIVTSPNGADRVGEALAGSIPPGVRVAAIGPGTARRATQVGLRVHLVPERAVAEGLLETFPAPAGSGRVVVARAEVARAALPDGLRSAGWDVTDVAAYRTVTSDLTAEQKRQVAGADGVVFTSSSTVDRLVAAVGAGAVPSLVVSIGPVTSATAAGYGVAVTVEASDHTIEGTIEALEEHASSWLD